MFEWDARKASSNKSKHSVSFEEAATVFFDPEAIDGPDISHSTSEARFLRIGRSAQGTILTISYTLREYTDGKTKIRIISARKASKKERKVYR